MKFFIYFFFLFLLFSVVFVYRLHCCWCGVFFDYIFALSIVYVYILYSECVPIFISVALKSFFPFNFLFLLAFFFSTFVKSMYITSI